jgi:membrane protein DedA with SNARE-associated domain
MLESAQDLISRYGYFGLYGLLMLGIIGVPVPDETLVTVSGFLIREGQMPLVPTFLAAFLGSSSGITVSYLIGRIFGFRLVHKYGHFFHVTDERLERFHRWYERTGRWTLLFGYFIPGVRHVTAIASGTSRLSWPSFAIFAYSGALVWVSTFLILGYFLGAEWEQTSPRVHRLAIAVAVGGLAFAMAFGFIRFVHYWRRRKPPADSHQDGKQE